MRVWAPGTRAAPGVAKAAIDSVLDGSGRTARLWANYVAMRYGLPPFVRLRPRPEADAYARAGAEAMDGNWKPTAEVFRVMLRGFL